MREGRWLARPDLYSLGLVRWVFFFFFFFFHSFFLAGINQVRINQQF